MKRAPSLLIFAILVFISGRASALDTFNCVKDLLPITEQSGFQSDRYGFEKPFVIGNRYLVFPEVSRSMVTGFFVYSEKAAWYYDAIEGKPIESLDRKELVLYDMIAQPTGLETITVSYMAGYGMEEQTKKAPVALGSSFLPVVGGMMSRSNKKLRTVYHNPQADYLIDIQKWVFDHSPEASRPKAPKLVTVTRKLVKLETQQAKSDGELWRPLKTEYSLRKKWIRSHNLEESAFRTFSRLMQSSCKE